MEWCTWFLDTGQYQSQDTSYVPQPGDIIFFEWETAATQTTLASLESCDGSAVYTIEGNRSDAMNRRSYNINSSSILGYGQIIK